MRLPRLELEQPLGVGRGPFRQAHVCTSRSDVNARDAVVVWAAVQPRPDWSELRLKRRAGRSHKLPEALQEGGCVPHSGARREFGQDVVRSSPTVRHVEPKVLLIGKLAQVLQQQRPVRRAVLPHELLNAQRSCGLRFEHNVRRRHVLRKLRVRDHPRFAAEEQVLGRQVGPHRMQQEAASEERSNLVEIANISVRIAPASSARPKLNAKRARQLFHPLAAPYRAAVALRQGTLCARSRRRVPARVARRARPFSRAARRGFALAR